MDINSEISEQIRLGNKYTILYADPPWTFETRSAKGDAKSPNQHYKTMTLQDIKDIDVKSIAADDALLFMWVYQPLLPEAIDVMKAWGFEYKSIGFMWRKLTKNNKEHISTGYYTRAGAEICLIGRRGKKAPERLDKGVRQVVSAKVREHSRKPDEIRATIKGMYDGPRIEIFGREQFDGWEVIGNEKHKFL